MSALSANLLPDVPAGCNLRLILPEVDTGRDDFQGGVVPPTLHRQTPAWRLSHEGRTFSFTQALVLHTWRDGEYFFTEAAAFNLIGYGVTQDAALKELSTHFAYFFDYYRSIPDEQLVDEGQKLKQRYAQFVVEERACNSNAEQ